MALIISAVAEFYSIVGLTAIFSAAFWPIVIMGASLGVGKVTAAVWLKLNWERASWAYRLYLVPAVAFLMLLTSIGCFGYLSKAHSDQSLVSGDAVAKVAIYDEKIKTSRDNIDANRRALKQMDDAVDQVMGRSNDEKGADKSVAIRRGQSKERARLLGEIEVEQKNIVRLNEERAPLAAEFRKVESEVGPIKYIAALVYGDNPDANVLERAVRLVIILIVAVFDPLALVLILAAQQSIRWAQEERDRPLDPDLPVNETHTAKETAVYEADYGALNDQQLEQIKQTAVEQQPDLDDRQQSFVQFENLTSMIAPGDPPPNEVETDAEKQAKRQWKAENPGETVKEHRRLHEAGAIDTLPWQGYINLQADNDGNIVKTGRLRGFGIRFPDDPDKGDSFIRVDQMPSALYKYNGLKWIEVDKGLSDQYAYDTAYIDHLIDKLTTGEYDPELLNDAEREQVAQRLQTNNKGA